MTDRNQALAAFYAAQRRGNSGVYGGPQLPAAPPPPAPPRPAAGQGSRFEAMLAEQQAKQPVNQDKGGGGYGGLFGGVTQGLGKVLGAVDGAMSVVGNVVPAINEEMAKLLPDPLEVINPMMLMVDEDRSRQDERGVLDKITDKSYGYGDNTYKTGGQWADRLIGFGGDVAMDPITYVGGAATKTAGLTGRGAREAMGSALQGAGRADDVVGSALKYGHAFLDDAARETVGAPKAGIYFGVGKQSVRLPGTGRVGASMEKGFARARTGTISKLTNPANLAMRVGKENPEFHLARRVANAGKTIDGMTPSEAAGVIRYTATKKAATKTATEVSRGEIDGILTSIPNDVEARAVTTRLQRGEAHPLRGWLDSRIAQLEKMGVKVPKLDNFVPQRQTRDGWSWMKDTPEGQVIAAAGGDMEGPTFLHTRRWKAGDKVELPNGKTFTFPESGLIEDYNKALHAIGAPERVFEDDIRVLMMGYADEVAEAMGTRAAFLDAMNRPGGLIHNLEGMTAEQLDTAAAMTANENLAAALRRAATAKAERAGERLGEAANFHDEVVGLLRQAFDQQISDTSDAIKGLTQELGQIRKLIAQGDDSKAAVTAKFDEIRTRIDANIEKLAADEMRIVDELAAEEAKLAAFKDTERGQRWLDVVARKQFQDMNDADIRELVESGVEIPPRLQQLVQKRLESVEKYEQAIATRDKIKQLEAQYASLDKKLQRMDQTPLTSDEIREAALDMLDEDDWAADVLPRVQGGNDLNVDLREELTAAIQSGDYEAAKAVVAKHLDLADLDEARAAQRQVVASTTNRKRGAFSRLSAAAQRVKEVGERKLSTAERSAAMTARNLEKSVEGAERGLRGWQEIYDEAVKAKAKLPTKTAAKGETAEAKRGAKDVAAAMEADRVVFAETGSLPEGAVRRRLQEADNAAAAVDAAEAKLDEVLAAERTLNFAFDVTNPNPANTKIRNAHTAYMDARVRLKNANAALDEARASNQWDEAHEAYAVAAADYEKTVSELAEAKYALDSMNKNANATRSTVGGGLSINDVELRKETLETLAAAADAEIASVPSAVAALDAKIAAAQDEIASLMAPGGRSEIEDAVSVFGFLSDYSSETMSTWNKLKYKRKVKFGSSKPDDISYNQYGKLLAETGDSSLLDMNSQISALQDDVNAITRSLRATLKGYGLVDSEVDDVVRMVGTQRFNDVVLYIGPEDVKPGAAVRSAKYRGANANGRPMTAFKLRKMAQEKFGLGGLKKAYEAAGEKMPFGATWNDVDFTLSAKMLGGKAQKFTAKSGKASELGWDVMQADRAAKAETILDAMNPRLRQQVGRDGSRMRAGRARQLRSQVAAYESAKGELLRKQQVAEGVATRVGQMAALEQSEAAVKAGAIRPGVQDLRRKRSETAYALKQAKASGTEAELRAEGDQLFREAWGDRALGGVADEMFREEDAAMAARRGQAADAQAVVNSRVDRWANLESQIGKREAAELKAIDETQALLHVDANRIEARLSQLEQQLPKIKEQRKNAPKKFGKKKGNAAILMQNYNELGVLMQEAIQGGGDAKDMLAAAELMGRYNKALRAADADKAAEDAMKAAAKMAEDNELAQQMGSFVTSKVREGFATLESRLFPEGGDYVMREELQRMMTNVASAFEDTPQWLRYYDEANKFFKTWATTTPGFHVRNFMSASFMNMTEGAGIRAQKRGLRLWREFVKARNSEGSGDWNQQLAGWLASRPRNEQEAFMAAFGSGLGGQFEWAEVGQSLAKGHSKAFWNNFLTNNSRKIGVDWVEGPQRLSLALHYTDGGLGFEQALAGVNRIHFDYSDLSNFDRQMKRIIPFYVFMSRNLPLQVEQMVKKPKAYAIYGHLMENLSMDEDGEGMPQWLSEVGGVTVGRDVAAFGGKDVVLRPDMPFARLGQEINSVFPNPTRMAASASPFLRVPFELGMNHSAFYDDKLFYEGEGGLKDQAMYAANNVIPPVAALQRLAGLGDYEGKAFEKQLNYMGVPITGVSDEQRRRALLAAAGQ